MAISRVGHSTVIDTNGGAPGAITPHASTATGDLLLFFHFSKINTVGSQTVTIPTGFTSLVNARTANGLIAIGWKFRVGGETTYQATIAGHTTGNSGDSVLEWIESYRGAHATTPVLATGTATDLASSLNMGSIPVPASTDVPVGGAIIFFGGREENVTGQTTLTGDGLTWAQGQRGDTTLGADAGAVTQWGLNGSASPITPTAKTITTTGTAATGLGVSLILQQSAAQTFFLGLTATTAPTVAIDRFTDLKVLPAASSLVASSLAQRLYLKTLAVLKSPAYSEEVLADSPMLYWRLGETSGSTAEDSSTNNRDGTYDGPTLGVTGLLVGDADKAASFNTNASVYTSSWSPWGEGEEVERTLEFLVTYTRSGATKRYLFTEYAGGGFGQTSEFYFQGDDVKFCANDANGETQVWAAAPANGVKTHVALRFRGIVGSKTVELFINGISQGSQAFTPGTPNVPGFVVGAKGSAKTDGWVGTIDEVAVYSGLLSSGRLLAHSAAAATAPGGGITVVPSLSQLRGLVRSTAAPSSATITRCTGLLKSATLGLLSLPVRLVDKRVAATQGGLAALTTLRSAILALTATQPEVVSIRRAATTSRSVNQATLGTLTRRANRSISAGTGLLGFLSKLTGRAMPVAQTSVASVTTARAYLRSLTALAPSSATLTRVLTFIRALTGSQPSSASLTRRANRSTTATEPESALLARQASRTTSAPAPAVATLTSIRAFLKALTAALPLVGSIRRALTTSRSTTQPSAATIRQAQSITRQAQAPEAASVRRATARTIAAAQAISATVASIRAYLRALTASAPSAASIRRVDTTSTTATAPSSATTARQARPTRTAAQTSVATITRLLSAARQLLANAVQAASVRRDVARSSTAQEVQTGTVRRYPQQITKADLNEVASSRRTAQSLRSAVIGILVEFFAGGYVPTLLFPLKVRVQEYISKVQASEPVFITKVREMVAVVKGIEPAATVKASEPEVKVRTDESGSMIVEVNEEGADS